MRRLLQTYGFAYLILMALACSCFMAGTAATPEPVPDFALRAPEIYRLEIGAAFFAAFYLATLAFLLALGGRGFAEFGTRGLKIEPIFNKDEGTLQRQAQFNRHANATLTELVAALEVVQAMVAEQERRLEILETNR